jgi:hypothetical protein
MTELVSGMPAAQLGTNLRECEDQSWFKVQVVPVFRFFACPRLNTTVLDNTSLAQGKYQYLNVNRSNSTLHIPKMQLIFTLENTKLQSKILKHVSLISSSAMRLFPGPSSVAVPLL